MEICVVGINDLILTRAHYVCEYSVKHVTGNTSITFKVIFKIPTKRYMQFFLLVSFEISQKDIKKSKIITKNNDLFI